jgi:hypothetical protein
MLLEDVFIIENLQVINEGNTGPMRVRGVFQRADEENNNGRIYPKALLEREITKLSESMKGRRLMGELDHPQHDSVKLSNVSHLITKLEAKGNEIIGEAEILDTPMGKVAKALIEGGVQVGISSRGMGTLSEGQDGKRYVNEDFRLITWDLVADPSTRGAFPALSESTNLNSMLVEEILNDVLPKVTKEKVFSTLLEETLNEAKMKKAKKKKKKPAKQTKGGLPDFSRDGKITKADVLMGRGVIPKPGQKMKTKKVAREDSSTLFANVGALLGEGDAAKALKAKKDFEVETANMSPDKRNNRKRGVFDHTEVVFPRLGMMLAEEGVLSEELSEGLGRSALAAGIKGTRAVYRDTKAGLKNVGRAGYDLAKRAIRGAVKGVGYIAGAMQNRGKSGEDAKKPDTTPDTTPKSGDDGPKPDTTPKSGDDGPKPDTTPKREPMDPKTKKRALDSVFQSNKSANQRNKVRSGTTPEMKKSALGAMASDNMSAKNRNDQRDAQKKTLRDQKNKEAKEIQGRKQFNKDKGGIKGRAIAQGKGSDAGFGSGVGAKSTKDSAERDKLRASIARAERKKGRQINLTPDQAAMVDWKIRLGNILIERAGRAYERIGALLGEGGFKDDETPEQFARRAMGQMARGEDPGIGAPRPKKPAKPAKPAKKKGKKN